MSARPATTSHQQRKSRTNQRGRRSHFGRGELAIDPATSVFINCPFDTEYSPLFHAIIFATTCCGFLARSALETGSVAESRMDRIANAVFSSRYSIHDLSRCRGEGDELLARFNMPLEESSSCSSIKPTDTKARNSHNICKYHALILRCFSSGPCLRQNRHGRRDDCRRRRCRDCRQIRRRPVRSWGALHSHSDCDCRAAFHSSRQ